MVHFLGCWRDSAVRAMKNIWFNLDSTATINKCIDICKKAGNLVFFSDGFMRARKKINSLGRKSQKSQKFNLLYRLRNITTDKV